MNNQKYRVSIVAMGNLIMSDDGVGIHLIKKLKQEDLGEELLLLEVGTSPLTYLEEISKSEKLIVIDAIRGGGVAGSIYCLTEDDIKSSCNINRDFHGYSLLNIIELSRELSGLPTDLIIYGVEPKNLGLGEELSPSVQLALANLVDLVKKSYRLL